MECVCTWNVCVHMECVHMECVHMDCVCTWNVCVHGVQPMGIPTVCVSAQFVCTLGVPRAPISLQFGDARVCSQLALCVPVVCLWCV